MSDWAAVASAFFAAVGLIFAGRQLLLGNQQAKEERRLWIKGVGVSWRAIETPTGPERDGHASWKYEIMMDNPGRFPVDRVKVRWIFPCPVQRTHFDGRLDPPTDVLELNTPVLTSGSHGPWKRRLRINYAHEQVLSSTYAEITFRDIEGQRTDKPLAQRTLVDLDSVQPTAQPSRPMSGPRSLMPAD